MNVLPNNYSLMGYKGMKPGNCGVVYMPYVPISITADEAEQLKKQKRANSTYVTISLDHPCANVRNKRGKVLDIRVTVDGVKTFCVLIDKINTCYKNGSHTFIGVPESSYEEEWIDEKYITNIEAYDENGNNV